MAKFASFLFAMALASFPNTAVSQPGGRRCHGTVGVQCGNLLLGQIAVCHPRLDGNVLCMVNAGSWRHDECCARQPNGAPGMMCAGGGEASTNCQAEWVRANDRVHNGYSWWRVLNPNFGVTTPLAVDRPLFCAPPNSKIHRSDTAVPFCCSGTSRGPSFLEALLDPDMRRCN